MRSKRGESERKMRFKVTLDVGNVTALQAKAEEAKQNGIKSYKTIQKYVGH